VNHKALLATTILGSGLFVLTGQQSSPSGAFTSAQAEAGRVAYENTCGKCHTSTLLGRKGDPKELPPISSLSVSYQDFVKGAGGLVRPLAGKDFIHRWGSRTVAELTRHIQETVMAFPPEGKIDQTAVNITAYVLSVNGAKAGSQPLTRTTGLRVSKITR
jgi:hypothetical protein